MAIRVASVNDAVKALVDNGAETDKAIKALQEKDKGFKALLTNTASKIINEEEKSIRLEGNSAFALISEKESYKVNFDSEKNKETFINHVVSGDLNGTIKVSAKIEISPEKINEFLEAVKDFGIAKIDYSVDKKEYEKAVQMKGDTCKILKKVVHLDTTYAVKYEMKGE